MSRPSLSRAGSLSSASSFSSISDVNVDTDADSQTANVKSSDGKRTRKRFSQEQLIVLEQAYHKSSHPSRDERETLSKQADMNVKSVTIWFQNKRQSERKIALSHAADRTAPLPLAMYPARPSPMQLSPTDPSNRLRLHPMASQSFTIPSRSQNGLQTRTASGFISLDRIASRSERVPRTPTKLIRHSSLRMSRSRSPEPLWESMLSSPVRPETSDITYDGPPESPSARDYIDFASRHGTRGSRPRGRRTLEWACAAARMTVEKEDNNPETIDHDEPMLRLAINLDNDMTLIDDDASTEIIDTEMESIGDSHEAITPDTSQIMFTDRPEAYNMAAGKTTLDVKTVHCAGDTDERDTEKDTEILNAAWVLCGFSTVRR